MRARFPNSFSCQNKTLQVEINVDKRVGRRQRIPGELARNAKLSIEDGILRVIDSVLDKDSSIESHIRFQGVLTLPFLN